MEIKLNGKALLGIALLSAGLAFGNYVSLVDAKSSGGVIVNETIDTTPVGTVAMWTTSTPPTGWIEMNGQSTSAYPELAAVVGANVPDVRGQFLRAWDHGKGVDSGRGLVSYQSQDFKGLWVETNQNNGSNYTHSAQYFKNVGGTAVGHLGVPNFTGAWSNPSAGIKIGFGNEEIRPTNVSIMYIIKAQSN